MRLILLVSSLCLLQQIVNAQWGNGFGSYGSFGSSRGGFGSGSFGSSGNNFGSFGNNRPQQINPNFERHLPTIPPLIKFTPFQPIHREPINPNFERHHPTIPPLINFTPFQPIHRDIFNTGSLRNHAPSVSLFQRPNIDKPPPLPELAKSPLSLPSYKVETGPVDLNKAVPVDLKKAVPVDLKKPVSVDLKKPVPVDLKKPVPVDLKKPVPVSSKSIQRPSIYGPSGLSNHDLSKYIIPAPVFADPLFGNNQPDYHIGKLTDEFIKKNKASKSPKEKHSGLFLSHNDAVDRLRPAGITVKPGCNDVNKKGCTSLKGIRSNAIAGLINFKENQCTDCPDLIITGGTENQHHGSGKKGHHYGYKVDIRPNPILNEYIIKNFMAKEKKRTGDNATIYVDLETGIEYADERFKVGQAHWDIYYPATYKP